MECVTSFLSTDVLLTSFEGTPVLQNRVSGLLEQWWCGEREGREGLVPHCLLYVIARTLNERAKVSWSGCWSSGHSMEGREGGCLESYA